MNNKPDVPAGTRRKSRYESASAWASVVAAIVAATGLFFTARSAGLQADEAKRQNDNEAKAQSRLISLWPSKEFSSGSELVTVSNRSEEPIYEFRLYIALNTNPSHGYLAIGTWESFQPCTKVTFDLRAIAKSYPETARLVAVGGRMAAFDYGIMFTDTSGQAWHRHASGMLHPTPWLEYLKEKGVRNPSLPPVFRGGSYRPLTTGDDFTIPLSGQPLVNAGPVAADGCDPAAA